MYRPNRSIECSITLILMFILCRHTAFFTYSI